MEVDDGELEVINEEGYITDNFMDVIDIDEINIYAKLVINTYTVEFYENTDYIYKEDTLLVTLAGRSFYKENEGGALVAYVYDTVYTGPVLVSTNADAVAFSQTYDSTITTYIGSFVYDDVAYYYSQGNYWMSGNYTDTSGFERKKYSVTRGENSSAASRIVAQYLLEDNSSSVSQSFEYGTSQNLTSNSYTKEGYKFVGWSTTPTGEVIYTDGQSVSNLTTENNGVVKLYAIWQLKTYNIYIAHYYSDWTLISTETVTVDHGTTYTPTAISVNGYYAKTFQLGDYLGTVGTDSFEVTDTYNANGGSGAPSSQTKVDGTALTLSTTKPTRTGYTFQGWSTSSTATTATYAAGGTYTANASATLYAVWEANTYTLTYDNNGGSGCTSKSVTYGSQIGTLCTPTRSGYTFVGWFDSTYKDSPLNYYADTNSDLKTAFGYDETSLWNHYNNYGKSEGRRISQYISTDVYSSTSNKTIYAGWISSYSNTWVSGKSGCFDVSPSTVVPNSFWTVKLNVCWSETYNAYTNTSKVSITGMTASLSDYYGYTFYLGGGEGDSTRGIYVNGSLLTAMSYHTGGYSVYFGATSTYYAVSGTFPMTSGEIAHSSDGTLTVPIRVYLAAVRSGYTTNYYSSFDSTVNVTLTDTR